MLSLCMPKAVHLGESFEKKKIVPSTQLIIRIEREPIDPSVSIYKICSDMAPLGWFWAFQNALPEIGIIDNILQQLGAFYPAKIDLFRAFDLCPLNNVKVVIMGQDPYHSTYNGVPQANGLSFSTNRGCRVQPSLQNIYRELADEYPEYKVPNHGDLSEWAEQGVLLLNTCLTVKPHQAKSHKEIWNGFIAKILIAISETNPECIYLLWGRKAQELDNQLGQRAIKLYASHPSPFSANRGTRDAPAFLGCGHFRQVNEYLERQRKEPINWQITNT